MCFQLSIMLSHEPGVRLGEDIEELHDMRVASRRLRAAMGIFRSSFQKSVIKKFRKGLQKTGRELGKVRDLDVFLEKLVLDIDNFSEIDEIGIRPLYTHWEQKRNNAQSDLVRYLDSEKYANFLCGFKHFLDTPFYAAKETKPRGNASKTVQTELPVILIELSARVENFDFDVEQASIFRLHDLRIEAKKIRYAVEFFREILDEESEQVIKSLKIIQDHLGDLNDAQIAATLIESYLDDTRSGAPSKQDAIEDYLQFKKKQAEQLIRDFPAAWNRFIDTGFGNKVVELASNF